MASIDSLAALRRLNSSRLLGEAAWLMLGVQGDLLRALVVDVHQAASDGWARLPNLSSTLNICGTFRDKNIELVMKDGRIT